MWQAKTQHHYNWNNHQTPMLRGSIPLCVVWPVAFHPDWSVYTLWSYIETKIRSEKEKRQWEANHRQGREPQQTCRFIDNLYLISHIYLFSLLETDKYEQIGLVLEQFKELWRDHGIITRGGFRRRMLKLWHFGEICDIKVFARWY